MFARNLVLYFKVKSTLKKKLDVPWSYYVFKNLRFRNVSDKLKSTNLLINRYFNYSRVLFYIFTTLKQIKNLFRSPRLSTPETSKKT